MRRGLGMYAEAAVNCMHYILVHLLQQQQEKT